MHDLRRQVPNLKVHDFLPCKSAAACRFDPGEKGRKILLLHASARLHRAAAATPARPYPLSDSKLSPGLGGSGLDNFRSSPLVKPGHLPAATSWGPRRMSY